MKKSTTDTWAVELLTPAANAIREKLGDGGSAIVRNEPFLIDGPDDDASPKLDWATWIECAYSTASSIMRTDVVHREIDDPEDSAFAAWQWVSAVASYSPSRAATAATNARNKLATRSKLSPLGLRKRSTNGTENHPSFSICGGNSLPGQRHEHRYD